VPDLFHAMVEQESFYAVGKSHLLNHQGSCCTGMIHNLYCVAYRVLEDDNLKCQLLIATNLQIYHSTNLQVYTQLDLSPVSIFASVIHTLIRKLTV
jgi:hypothetical protein